MRKFKLIVQNIVSNAHLGAPINCELVAEELQARLNHKVFPALVSVCKETRTTNCCFGSGQIVVSGSRQELQAIASCYLIIARISRALHRTDLQLENFTIDNIVCSCHLGFQLNVDAFFESHKTHCEYDPEQFPGAHWRPAEAEVGFVLFESGRIACVGLKSYDQIPVAEKLLENLQDFELGKEKTAWTGQARRGRVSTTKLKKLNKTAQASTAKVDSHQFFEEFVQQVCPLLKSIYDLNGLSSLTTTTLSTSSTDC